MLKEKNTFIVDLLIQSTKNKNLIWNEIIGDASRRGYIRNMSATGEDGTKYEIEVKFIMNSKSAWQLESSPSLWIRSIKLPNGSFYVYGGEHDIKGLRQVIMDKYCQDMKPSEQVVEDALDSISKGINIAEYRDSKLNKVLGVFGLNNK